MKTIADALTHIGNAQQYLNYYFLNIMLVEW